MKTNDPVPLDRRFSPVAALPSDSDERQIQELFGFSGPDTWEDLDKKYRSVVLAEAGTGKTFEMEARAEHVEQQGRPAFFIRIEDIEHASNTRLTSEARKRLSNGFGRKTMPGSTSIPLMKPGSRIQKPLRRRFDALAVR